MMRSILKRREVPPYFPAAIHARRLEELAEELSRVRHGLLILSGGEPDSALRRTADLIGAISKDHSKEAHRIVSDSQTAYDDERSHSYRRWVAAVVFLAILGMLAWKFANPSSPLDVVYVAAGPQLDPAEERHLTEQEWISLSKNRFAGSAQPKAASDDR